MDKATQIQQLLTLSKKGSGASPHEAHLAAVRAAEIAAKNGMGQLAARARVAVHKASRRLSREA